MPFGGVIKESAKKIDDKTCEFTGAGLGDHDNDDHN
jgi:hypothetical protein